MLSAYPQYTLLYSLARLLPTSVQSYYNLALEPFFAAAVPSLAKLKATLPSSLALPVLVMGDLALATGLGVFLLGLRGAVALVAIWATTRFLLPHKCALTMSV
uniref:Uncharacterized protein n=1 Tax=Calcidiscus leptoporus TaxID=127549 RepID=A0A7S0IUN2_9EUKA|mmetsp:Transcript_22744/g.52423  ORF Transcript_22744/g.52423 Transcript_22744/m.52423 type:complete len:103 (+) Transcript_22744:1-309(+)